MSKLEMLKQHMSGLKTKRRTQNSTMISEVGSLFVMIFVVAILLLYIDYSRIINTKIELDNLNKNMLLTAEMYGGLSEEDMDAFYDNLENMGITKASISNGNFPTIKENGQYAYGERIEISYTIQMKSPVYARFHNSFISLSTSEFIDIHIYGVTVSKW